MMRRHILKWTFIGLAIRFLIMPFSFLGPDIFFIYFPPFKFIGQGLWNPYLFLKESFPRTFDPYYPPVIFFIISIFLFLFKHILPNLHGLFAVYEPLKYTWGGNTIHFADAMIDYQLFRTLFIFKIPYLFFDFGTGWFLFQILKSDERKSLLAYKIWMLNPFVLHSCYASGQIDIVTVFFISAAIYCSYANRRYWAVGLLSFGVLTKILPILLMPFAILLLGSTFKERFKLSLTAIILIATIITPFYLSSPDTIIDALFFSPGGISRFRQVFFIGGYLTALCLFFFAKKKDHIDLDLIISSFVIVLLLFYSFYVVTLRYFILITPLLIYIALKNRAFWLYNAIFLVTLFELKVAGNGEQFGLFAALHPEFFSNLPVTDSFLNLIVNVKYIHQLMYRLFFISSLLMIAHIFWVNKKLFEFPLTVGKK